MEIHYISVWPQVSDTNFIRTCRSSLTHQNRFSCVYWVSDPSLSALNTITVPFIDCRYFNTLGPRQDGRHFLDDIFKCNFLNKNDRISLKKSLVFVPKVRINNIPALIQIMAWRRSGDKPLSEPMVVSLLTNICVTRPQWVNVIWYVQTIQFLIWRCHFTNRHIPIIKWSTAV